MINIVLHFALLDTHAQICNKYVEQKYDFVTKIEPWVPCFLHAAHLKLCQPCDGRRNAILVDNFCPRLRDIFELYTNVRVIFIPFFLCFASLVRNEKQNFSLLYNICSMFGNR